ncbi:MAG: DUF2520 domain-containing protein [Actinobacteria bacterium]|nr:DUF2520 domain-containing protein [Actinomycetota bacterium]
MNPDISPPPGPAARGALPGRPGGHPARLAVGVIGVGRAGTALGAALARAGHAVVAASAVSDASLRRARAAFPRAVIAEPGEVVRRADLILLTVPDDVLPGLVAGLAATAAPWAGRMLAHASGRYGVAVLEPAARQGALPLALHPVMTFTGRADDVDRLHGICFGVTAPDAGKPAAEALVIEMGGEPVFVAEQDRDLYHAAIAGAANHLITLVTQAADLLAAAGVTNPARLLGPLLSASLDNALRFGDAGLTGPVARGDAATVAAHVAALEAMARDPGVPRVPADAQGGSQAGAQGASGSASAAMVGAYVAMARLTADRALAAGILRPADAERLLGVLGGRP